MTIAHSLLIAGTLSAAALGAAGSVEAATLRVTIKNLAPQSGTFLTPLWVGFHDGTFDTYDIGSPILQPGLEALAEDGDTAPLSADFAASGTSAGNQQGTVASGPLAPGAKFSLDLKVDPANQYFSYATMVIPSNDTFLGNGSPLAHKIFDDFGTFAGAQFVIAGAAARDAGTEVNDEIPGNTAFFGQSAPNTGIAENGVVQVATGFNPSGSGGILDDPMFAMADYTAAGYQFAEITVSAVPLPAGLPLLLVGIAGLGALRLRRAA